MSVWATVADVKNRWVGAGEPTDDSLIQALLDDAETIILSKYPLIQDRITAETLPLAVVKMVAVRMVTRVLRNPENLSSWQQTTGPFSQSRTFGSGNLDIWISEEEEELLAPQTKGKAFEVNLAPYAGIIIPSATVVDIYSQYGYYEENQID
jgi:hypothetical protein